MPDVIDLAEQYRRELEAGDAKALGRLVRSYQTSYQQLADKVELFTA